MSVRPDGSAASAGESSAGGGPDRLVLHLDMDAFFASVEILRHPELRGRPVVVGGDGPRGVVAAASYEARAYGVHSAMPSIRAKRRCPDAVFLHGDHAHYAAVSRRIMAILRDLTPLVEPLSLDEAFCDVSGLAHVRRDVAGTAEELRRRIRDTEGLECAVGVGSSKLVSKLASKRAKPVVGRPGSGPGPGIGVLVVTPDDERQFLEALPVGELWGVGPATLKRLGALGVVTVGDLAAVPEQSLRTRFGATAGERLAALSRGVDTRPVVPDQAPRSVGHEETYVHDLADRAVMTTELLRLANATAARLVDHGLVGRTVQLKVRFGDFATITRATTFPEPTASARAVAIASRDLLAGVDTARGVRLLGVTVTNLSPESAARQLTLGLDGPDPGTAGSWHDAEAVVDDVRARFGPGAIAPAALIADGTIDVRRRGDQQWGKRSSGR